MKNLKGLAPNTKKVLRSLSDIENLGEYTFVGGSALSIHLQHRLSEDLDFFSWNKELKKESLLQQIKKVFNKNVSIENIGKNQLDLKIEGVKVTFFADNWDELSKRKKLIKHVHIGDIRLLTGMKLNTLFLRAKYRDYYDLYVINRKVFSVIEMYNIIKAFMPEINKKLFQTALTYVDDIEEDNIYHLSPVYNVTAKEIQKHFEEKIYLWIHG